MSINANLEVNKNDSIRNVSVPAQILNVDDIPLGKSNIKKPLTKSEVLKNVNEIIEYNQKKLLGLKDKMGGFAMIGLAIWFKLLGIDSPHVVVAEGEKLCFDEKFLKAIRDFATSSEIKDFGDFISNEKTQDDILKLVSDFTKVNKYENIHELLNKKIVEKETKAYLNDASKVF